MDDTLPGATESLGSALISGTVAAATVPAANAFGMAESKAELYLFTHLFGSDRGTAFYNVLTGNATVQSAVAGQNLKAVTWLEALFLKLTEPTLLSALQKVGLA